ncbi:hypothetical protein V6x_51800 [Gimesia chilikensis]|uniref:Uncharacterized protein n=1 Tax=Gimesia chilikensis TaxID=2605989 RepID=A0A517WJN9_9PLAN|nr:hypothetical protein [Gimesia chilikensis]QDU05443.1 hypothetical protein V6x_51800 [Gimesia chilikensis]
MLNRTDITLIIAALQFWAEEMDPEDEQCLRNYAEAPNAEQPWTPAEIHQLRSRLKTAHLKYVVSNESRTALQDRELHSTSQEAFETCNNPTDLVGTLLLPEAPPEV